MTASAGTKVNLGCGSRFHPDWINFDIAPSSPEVRQADLSKGLPLPDGSCDVVYHAAVLEHMRQADASSFMTECHRVLRPGGIVRVGVPDLENLCRLYLDRLAQSASGDALAEHDYDWIMLELLDQTVRERSGGAMLDFLAQDPIPNEPFVYERIGEEGREIVEGLRRQPVGRLELSGRNFAQEIRWKLASARNKMRGRLSRAGLSNDDAKALEIGRFRMAGEVHQWLYDRFSLSRLLAQAGFVEPMVQNAFTSLVPDWVGYHLDSTPDGQVTKPDLFFMEAVKRRA